MNEDWNALTAEEASVILFKRFVELILNDKDIILDSTIRLLTQRLYGDYRTYHNTQEYKRAVKHVKHYKNTGLGKELY